MNAKLWPALSVQTFTLRRQLKKPHQVLAVFQRLSDLGIRAVELAYIDWNEAMVSAICTASKQTGVQVVTTQITFNLLQNEFDQMVRYHHQLNCEVATVSVLPSGIVKNQAEYWHKFGKQLDALGARYFEQGIQLLYHHHDYEFTTVAGERGLDRIINQTKPKNVGLVIDVYWAQRAGVNPAEFIRLNQGRVQAIHLRDYSVSPGLLGMKISDCELGAGNLDIESIIESCRDSNVRFMAIEQNTANPFESIECSTNHLKALNFSHLLEVQLGD